MAKPNSGPNGSTDKKTILKQIKKTNPSEAGSLLQQIGHRLSSYKQEVATALLHRKRKTS